MAKKKQKGITIQKKRKNGISILVVPPHATTRQILAAYKRQFTAADLAKYLQDDEDSMVPMEQVLAEMEQIHREETEKRQKRRRKK
jgi:hypothetical protein